MKRSVLVILLMGCLSQTAVAEVVKPDAAARYAASLMGVNSLSVSENNISRAPGHRGVAADPEYYVFNNPEGGWIIISAEDRVSPVIGYSNTGSFDISNLPSNIKWWMDGVAECIDMVREQDLEAPASVRRSWQALSTNRTPTSTKKVLQTANWNQEEPYTLYCPYINGENVRAVAGCVATAMSIVMRYYQWPERGRGQIGGYTTVQYPTYISAYPIDNHVYNWADMPLTDAAKKESAWTDAQLHEVAQLMHDCGVMVEMDYSIDGSSASDKNAAGAMKEHMSYAESATFLSRSLYSLDEWFTLIRNEIDNDRVVMYSGNGDGGGHAFVCDGYDTEGSKLHINWGWGGSGNGYFTLDLTIREDDGFPEHQGAIVGIVPDTVTINAEDTEPLFLMCNNGFAGMQPYEWADMKKGSEMSFIFAWLFSSGSYEGDAEFKVCLMDKDGMVKQEGWIEKREIDKYDSYMRFVQTGKTALEVTPELTDYFQLFYKIEGGSWRPVKGNYDVLPGIDGVFCGVTPNPIIIVPDNCTAGQKIKPVLTKSHKQFVTVSWKHNRKQIEGSEITLTEGANEIRADVECLDGTEFSIVRTVTIK